MKRLASLVAAVPIAGLLLIYGTLSPCEMLKKDLRAAATNWMMRDLDSGSGIAALAMMVTGPVIDNLVDMKGPLDCAVGVIRLKVDRETFLAEIWPGSSQSKRSQSGRAAAQAQIELLGAALDQYSLDVGSYPDGDVGLEALVRNPNIAAWNGPYLKLRVVPNDPWGRPYRYRCCPGQFGLYDLWSEGADAAPGGGGENAVSSWASSARKSQACPPGWVRMGDVCDKP